MIDRAGGAVLAVDRRQAQTVEAEAILVVEHDRADTVGGGGGGGSRGVGSSPGGVLAKEELWLSSGDPEQPSPSSSAKRTRPALWDEGSVGMWTSSGLGLLVVY